MWIKTFLICFLLLSNIAVSQRLVKKETHIIDDPFGIFGKVSLCNFEPSINDHGSDKIVDLSKIKNELGIIEPYIAITDLDKSYLFEDDYDKLRAFFYLKLNKEHNINKIQYSGISSLNYFSLPNIFPDKRVQDSRRNNLFKVSSILYNDTLSKKYNLYYIFFAFTDKKMETFEGSVSYFIIDNESKMTIFSDTIGTNCDFRDLTFFNQLIDYTFSKMGLLYFGTED
ncbi:MAG: hypothetical protein CO119_11935 [Flavobacteriales bacterium CG_4_9_14_3_um_filter_40_17]|nr:MAG: hypothetical protein CO119_11935 [Flavobacteriales bacterium CG_4_9_14_3_um_filter_40_17]